MICDLNCQWGFAYGIAALLGGVVGLAEIMSSFQTTTILALRTVWAWFLVVLNSAMALLAIWVIGWFIAPNSDPILLAFAVGLGFPALIRTNFTVAKRLDAGSDQGISLNLGWIYDQFQSFIRTQIDLAQVNKRQKLLRSLLDRVQSLDELVEMAHYLIQERALFSQAQIEQMQKYVDGVRSSEKLSELAKRVTLARFVLDTGGPGYIQNFLSKGIAPHKPKP